MMGYAAFLATKRRRIVDAGIHIETLHPELFDFQVAVTKRALRRGRYCIFAGCGLGKTVMQLEWAEQVAASRGPVLILTPLAVAQQTEREARRFGYSARYADSQENAPSIAITNYQKLERFDPERYAGIVLDESSILKSYTGKFRNRIIQSFRDTPFRLCCSATPAPNDYMELGNHAEFMGAMTRSEMLSMFFVHDGGSTQNWRLKGHAVDEFWRWVSQWATMFNLPSDIGFDSVDFTLPPLEYKTVTVESGYSPDGMLLNVGSPDMQARRAARYASLEARCDAAADLANQSSEQWLLWCDLNAESKGLARRVPDAVEVCGSDSDEHKTDALMGFVDGRYRVLITKPSIAGFGLNLQNCCKMAFVGLSDSYEKLYQATRRCWRFGQERPVTAYIITSSAEGAVLENVMRKEADHTAMQDRIAGIMKEIEGDNLTVESCEWKQARDEGRGWEVRLGDAVEELATLDADSIDYSVFSPPFSSLYTYSNSMRDLGNCEKSEDFYQHFRFIAAELVRVVKPGRLISFHCMLLPTSKVRDGIIGLTDFRGDLIRIFQDAGAIFHSEVCIWKDPVTAMQRTKALGLLHKQIRKDSSMCRQGIPDYVVTMRVPGENADYIAHDPKEFPVSLWQRWASPIWTDINPNDTLQFSSARENEDERHICPLQLEVIRRCLGLWSKPGDLVLSPFAGIGSEGVESLRWGRRFLGIELKESYYRCAVKNLQNTELEKNQGELFQ